MPSQTTQVAVIGAGPYGLAAAAHLRASGMETVVFGQPMEFWEKQMPKGMFLRSAWYASDISEPSGRFSLDSFKEREKQAFSAPGSPGVIRQLWQMVSAANRPRSR